MQKESRQFLFVVLLTILSIYFLGIKFVSAQKLTGKYADKFFYEKFDNQKNQVFMVNRNGKKAKKLFFVNDYIGRIEVAANNKLRFFTSPEMNKSYIYYYDLVTRHKKLVRKVKGYILQSGWYDKNNYAYISETELPNYKFKLTLYLVTNGKKKKLAQWQGNVYGRGGYYEDDDSLNFSPDGKKIMHISTSSVRSSFDYNIYIFNRKGRLINKIKNATHPTWISNSKIIYRKYQKGYLYKYNLKTEKSKRIKKIPKNSFDPKYLPENNKIAFWVGIKNPKVFVYNLKNKKLVNTKIRAAYPKWLDKERLLVNKARKCDPNNFMCPQTANFGILNLKNKKFKIITKDLRKHYFTQYQ
ncbi:MAG: hypothetical protein AB1465_03080 [Patescibacteria group bacterium]